MDDDFISRFFGRRVETGLLPNLNQNSNNEFLEMFKQMNDMMRMFNFGSFKMIEGPNSQNSSFFHESQKPSQNLRDSVLKPQNEQNNPVQTKDFNESFFPSTPFFMEKMFEMPSFGDLVVREETEAQNFEQDLDEKVSKEGFDKVLREDLMKKESSHNENNRFFSYGQTSSFRRVQRPDGSIEEIKTQRDSSGREIKTVTRTIGDKAHTIVEKKSSEGIIEETDEFYKNFDAEKIEDFNKIWSGSTSANRPSLPRNEIFLNDPAGSYPANSKNHITESRNGSFFANLFSSWFK